MREGELDKAENNKWLYSSEISCLEFGYKSTGIGADPRVVVELKSSLCVSVRIESWNHKMMVCDSVIHAVLGPVVLVVGGGCLLWVVVMMVAWQ